MTEQPDTKPEKSLKQSVFCQLSGKNMSENEAYKRSNKENLQVERHRETGYSKLYPLTEPVGGQAVMYESSKQSDNRDDLAHGKALDREYGKYRLCLIRLNCLKGKCFCRMGYDKKDQTEDNDVFQPHFFECKGKDRIRQCAEFKRNRIGRHTIHHTENHESSKHNTLKLCFWHKKSPFLRK